MDIFDIAVISGIASNSKEVKKGYAYFAIKGDKYNGEDFICEAISNGATHVIVGEGYSIHNSNKDILVRYIKTPNVRAALSEAASLFYNGQPENIAAVTGTNGKTSVAYFVLQFAERQNLLSASIGTLGLMRGSVVNPSFIEASLTTPGIVEIHKTLHHLQKDGVTHLVMEASSHGLVQHRLDSVNIKVGAFTNLSRDHLDYHGNMNEYLAAKLKLFRNFDLEYAVFNSDIPESKIIRKICRERHIKMLSYGVDGSDIRLLSVNPPNITIQIDGVLHTVMFDLGSGFQVYNMLCALCICYCLGMRLDVLLNTIPVIKAPPGRLEKVCNYNGASVYTDYAHTPDALYNVLSALKSELSSRVIDKGKLYLVFGCGGNRDKGKRYAMGQIAGEFADTVIITDDNPRNENPASIRRDILDGCEKGIEVGDRREAIYKAMKMLDTGDVLLVAGKGHENYQIIGDNVMPFSDKDVVLSYSSLL